MRQLTKRETAMAGAFLEAGDGRQFSRVAGGLAWPARGKPGFLVVLGEDLKKDPDFGVRHVRRLTEATQWQGESFMHPEPLLRCALEMARLWLVPMWYAPQSVFEHTALRELNRELERERGARVRVTAPPHYYDGNALTLYNAMVRKRVATQKTLHFGESLIPGDLATFPPDLTGVAFDDHPPAAAFFCALAALEFTTPNPTRRRRVAAGPADSVGGY
jgi:hypothetical protein